MKAIRVLSHAVLTVSMMLAGPVLAGPENQIGEGRRVAAKWTDDGYYLGTVTGVKKSRYKVLFEDGDRLTVDAANVVALSELATFQEGDRVLAAWKGVRLFPGVVVEVHPKACLIRWDDGDEPLLVSKDKMMAAATGTVVGLQVGDHVMAAWKDSHLYPGVIAEVSGGQYLIKWDDGDEPLLVPGSKIKPATSTAAERTGASTFTVGDRVLATWKNSHMYPAIIAEVHADACVVQWEDGDLPMLVANDKIKPAESSSARSFQVGDHVMATWKNSHMYPGVIAEVHGDQCLVRWDDGDEPMLVPVTKIAPWHKARHAANRVPGS